MTRGERRMTNKKRKIGVVAPGSRMSSQVAARVRALVATLYPDRTPEIHFHPQCLASHGHFAGDDATRARAFLEIANDESYDAVWCARGGYGSCRVAEAVMRGLAQPATRKAYPGHSHPRPPPPGPQPPASQPPAPPPPPP